MTYIDPAAEVKTVSLMKADARFDIHAYRGSNLQTLLFVCQSDTT